MHTVFKKFPLAPDFDVIFNFGAGFRIFHPGLHGIQNAVVNNDSIDTAVLVGRHYTYMIHIKNL